MSLSSELEGILLDESKEENKDIKLEKETEDKKLKKEIKKKKLSYDEYLNERQRILYQELRDHKYPAFVRAIRKDMLSKKTSLTKDEYISSLPTQIKVSRHFKYVGKTIAHLIVLMAEAKKEKNLEGLKYILSKLVRYLQPHFKDIDYKIEKDTKIIFILGDIKYDVITFLEKLSINEVLGWEKALEVKQDLERRWEVNSKNKVA